MVSVRLATPQDLDSINQMLIKSIMPKITANYINDRDITLVAKFDIEIIGCLHVGVFASGTVGYIDKFYIEPHYARKQIGRAISRFALEEAHKRGIKEVFGVIQHSMHHDKSAMNALKCAMGSDGKLYTYVNGFIPQMVRELNLESK